MRVRGDHRFRRPAFVLSVVAASVALVLVAGIVVLTGPGPALPALDSPLQPAPTVAGGASVQGTISAPGGPYLRDSRGRVVFFHGVNVVYKHPPYEVFPDPGKPWDFTAADASL